MTNFRNNPSNATNNDPANPVPPRLVLNVLDFATRYGVTRRTVWKLLKRGLPHFKFSPHQRLIPVPEADDWMNQNYLIKRQREAMPKRFLRARLRQSKRKSRKELLDRPEYAAMLRARPASTWDKMPAMISIPDVRPRKSPPKKAVASTPDGQSASPSTFCSNTPNLNPQPPSHYE